MQREWDKRSLFTQCLVLCAALAALCMDGCRRPPDEARIRASISAMKDAAQARDAGGVLAYIAADFAGQRADVDRDGLARILKLQFLRKDGIDVALGSIMTEIDGDRATARFTMTLADASQRWVPSGRETYAVVTGWRRAGGEWICYNAEWTPKN